MSLLIGLDLKSAFHVESDPSGFDRNTSANSFWLVVMFSNHEKHETGCVPADLLTISKIHVRMVKVFFSLPRHAFVNTWEILASVQSTQNATAYPRRPATEETHGYDIAE